MKDTFTQINDKWWGIGLDPYELLILARVASWIREGKEYFESKERVAKEIGAALMTTKNKFKSLEDRNILVRDGKHKRMVKYKINQTELDKLIRNKDKYTRCTNNERLVHQVSNISTPDVLYNTNKTSSNKTSFREEETLLESSSSKTPKGPNLKQMEAFVYELNKEQ